MRGKWLVLCVAVLAVAGLSGCGSNSGSGGSEVSADVDSVTNAGIVNCSQCHAVQNSDWLAGRHANVEDDATHNASPSPSLHAEGSSCQPCHNSTLDALNMPEAYGVSIRDVISCEACHGGGSAHRGVGPIPVPRPDAEDCLQCHAEFDAETGEYAPLRSRSGHSPGAVKVVGYLESGHADAPRDLSTRSGTVGCNRCHSDEGTKLYGHLDNVDDITDADGRGRGAMPLGIENLSSIQCRTCHNPHDVGGAKLLKGATAEASAQYNTCNHCHAGDKEELTYHINHEDDETGLLDREILDTHYDDPATASLLEGYVVRKMDDSACADCHDVHSGDVSINHQWGNSGHSGNILKAKKAAYEEAVAADLTEEQIGDAVRSAGASDDTSGGGFTHYDWDAANRQSCQMCHTATGFVNYVADPVNYDPTLNDFSHLADWVPGGSSGQNEMLYCWGCHENAATGALRVAGAVTAVYTYNDEPVVFPDVGSSNTCVVCHSGRGNNEEASTSSRFAGHHAPAAADLFSEYSHVAYEYPGLDYSNPLREDGSPFFVHDTIGVDSGEGPCVSCHMGDEANHTFAVVEKDENGLITDVLNKSLCDTCHTPGASYEITAAKLEEEAEGYKNAGELVQDLINQENGLNNYTGAVINNSNELENDRGAFQNAKLPTEEPGGFAHNRYYVKRALFDAIDWVDNGALDGTIADYSATYPEATHWLGTTRP